MGMLDRAKDLANTAKDKVDLDKVRDAAGKAKGKVDGFVDSKRHQMPDAAGKAYDTVSGAAERVIPGDDTPAAEDDAPAN